MGKSPTPKPINELTENDCRNLFKNCTSVSFQETDEKASNMPAEAFDGFDWNKDMEEAYKTD